MAQEVKLRKSKEHQSDALWWRPFFSLQEQFNNSLHNNLNSTPFANFLPNKFWHSEENILHAAQHNINQLFGQIFNNRQMLTPWLFGHNTEPYVDVTENKNSFKVRAELPGVDVGDLDIATADSAIIIKGEKQQEKTEKDECCIRKECCYGKFSRTIALPDDADLDKAKANFDQNVLTVEVPKKSQANSKVVKIESSQGSAQNKQRA